jgi:transcriptional regulator GlxA family with amidase domain
MANMPTRQVVVLLQEETALSVALLMRDILVRTNALVGRPAFSVVVSGARRDQTRVDVGPVSVRLATPRGAVHDVIVPPLSPGSDPFDVRPDVTRRIRRWHDHGARVHCACLGSIVVAASGLLREREATTHWAWVDAARTHYPDVNWQAARMICDTGDVVSAGGFLAAVDLTLALVERTCSRAVSHELGRRLLVDSVRQHQSVYATAIAPRHVDQPWFRRLSSWIDAHLSEPITVEDMAKASQLGTRTFHRTMQRDYGLSPKKLLQLKRIERVQGVLRTESVSVEAAIQGVGVSDVPSFRKIFQRELGLSPAEFRRRVRPT